MNLQEKSDGKLGVTGNREQIMRLIGVVSQIIEADIVVEGHWNSYDGIAVDVCSALVSSRQGASLAKKLSKVEPYDIWLPYFEACGSGDEYLRAERENFEAWIVLPSRSAKLDEHDPLGTVQAILRPYLCNKVRKALTLKTSDSFNRIWKGRGTDVRCVAEAWGSGPPRDEDRSICGRRLKCSQALLRKLLKIRNSELVISIKLKRYDKGYGTGYGQFFKSTAVIRITKDLECVYYAGRTNYTPETKNHS